MKERFFINRKTKRVSRMVDKEMAENKEYFNDCDIYVHIHEITDLEYEYQGIIAELEDKLTKMKKD